MTLYTAENVKERGGSRCGLFKVRIVSQNSAATEENHINLPSHDNGHVSRDSSLTPPESDAETL